MLILFLRIILNMLNITHYLGVKMKHMGLGRMINKFKKMSTFGMLAFALAACQSGNIGDGLFRPSGTIDSGLKTAPVLTAQPIGEIIGRGDVRISLLIPKSAPGNAAAAANQIYNGALLAMQDFGGDSIQLVVKDTKGTAADAQLAASEAVQEGSSAIIGPLFSSSVSAASAISQPAGRPIIGFSTDTSVARRGVYLISYTPQADTARMINFAISQGKRNIQAFIANNAEGIIRKAVLKQIANQQNININITNFDLSGPGIEIAARNGAVHAQSADAIYIPDGGQIPSVFLSSLKRSGIKLTNTQILGSGQWESVDFSKGGLNKAWYTGRDITNFASFATRYKSQFNTDASVLSAIGYDAVTLATTLVRSKGTQGAFTPETLEDRNGFAGINGIFRLNSNGTPQRGLAIYQVNNGAGTILQDAPKSF